MNPNHGPRVIRATRAMRLRIGAVFVAIALAFTLGQFVLLPWLSATVDAGDVDQQVERLRTVFHLAGALGALIALYCLAYGIRILRSGEMPPPNADVVVDTPVRTGAVATLGGALLVIASGVILMMSAQMAFEMPAVVEQLRRQAPP
jgi:hypothetical protein